MEVQHLLRVVAPPTELAKNFSAYCKRYSVITRGLCKIGYIPRFSPSSNIDTMHHHHHHSRTPDVVRNSSSSSPSSLLLRGLVANKNLKKGENIVMLSERACIHPGRALRCSPFLQVLPPIWAEKWLTQPRILLHNERLHEGSLVRHHQWLLALYMSYMILGHRLQPEIFTEVTATTTSSSHPAVGRIPDVDVIHYLNFMPRSEGDFQVLAQHLRRSLDSMGCSPMQDGARGRGEGGRGTTKTMMIPRDCEAALAKHFNISPAEVRAVVLYSLSMVFSRMVPVDHKGLLRASFRMTPLEQSTVDALLDEEQQQQPSSSSVVRQKGDSHHAASHPHEALYSKEFVTQPLSFLCPIVDMCNHAGRSAENVAVMVPTTTTPPTMSSSTSPRVSSSPTGDGGQSSVQDSSPIPHHSTTTSSSSSSTGASSSPIICLRALRDISKGEELTMCYGDTLNELQIIWGMPEVLE